MRIWTPVAVCLRIASVRRFDELLPTTTCSTSPVTVVKTLHRVVQPYESGLTAVRAPSAIPLTSHRPHHPIPIPQNIERGRTFFTKIVELAEDTRLRGN